jgi:hypothetical protein
VSAEPGRSVMFAAKRSLRFQSPPHERPAPDEVLLLRQPPANEGERETWRLPVIGEFEHGAKLEPWTGSTLLARIAARFEPPGLPGCDYFWASIDIVRDVAPTIPDPHVPPALRRFDGPLLDQVLALVEALVDDATRPPTLKENRPMATRSEFIEAQSRATRLLQAFGDSAGADPFVPGESLLGYRARLAAKFQPYRRRCQKVDLTRVGDPNAFGAIENQIYLDAAAEAAHPTQFKRGELRAIPRADASGRMITTYRGDPDACWNQFNPKIQYVRRILTPGTPRVQ